MLKLPVAAVFCRGKDPGGPLGSLPRLPRLSTLALLPSSLASPQACEHSFSDHHHPNSPRRPPYTIHSTHNPSTRSLPALLRHTMHPYTCTLATLCVPSTSASPSQPTRIGPSPFCFPLHFIQNPSPMPSLSAAHMVNTDDAPVYVFEMVCVPGSSLGCGCTCILNCVSGFSSLLLSSVSHLS